MRISHIANRVKSGRFLGLLFFIAIVMLVCAPSSSEAQSLEDLMNVKVNKLTDKQIEDLLIRGEEQGLSNQQILNMARKRGMPSDEVLKLKKRMDDVNEVRLKRRNEKVAATEQLRKALQYGGENLFESIKTRDSLGYELTILEKKIFGFAFFHNKALNFTPNFNMPTPKNYILGPGDQVIINIFGANNDNFVETITPDGKVSIRLVGLVHLSGLTIEMANSFLKEKLSDFYAGLRGSNPNTFISVTLGSVRTLKVNIVGEVKNPGTYSVPSMTRVFNALYAAGGPTANGTFRSIQVYRGGKLQSEVDIYQFLTKGQEDSNIGLEDNDVILVRPVTHRVEIEGEVRVPGLFEMKKGESLKDLLYYAGGFNELGFRESITVKRIGDNSKRIENVFADGFGSFRPIDGDVFIVAEMSDRYTNRVQIEGAVLRPGQYEVQDSLTIKGLIDKAGGLMGDAFLNRAVLYRTSKNFTLEVESIDLGKILDGTSDDVLLRNEDLLSISSVFDLQEEYSLEISGEVNKPGIYPYAANMTVADLILRAGGLTEAAANSILEIARRVRNDSEGKIATIITVPIDRDLSISNEQQNTILEPFDHVFVRKSPGYRVQRTVKVEGEVNYPGDYALESVTMRISDLLKRSGGLNQFAYAKGATLIRKTEYAPVSSEEETALTELSNLQSNSVRRDAENIEAEKQMLKRVNRKIQAGKEDFVAQELVSKKNEKLEEARIERLLRTGVINRADLREVELVGIDLEKIIEAPGSIHDLILEDGDIVTIPKELQTVRVRGEVLYPVTTRFVAGEGLRSYIGKAGGYSQEASRRKAFVLYANGDVDRTRGFLLIRSYPKIEPGAEIIVPELVRRRRVNPSEFIGLATSFLTLYLLYERTF